MIYHHYCIQFVTNFSICSFPRSREQKKVLCASSVLRKPNPTLLSKSKQSPSSTKSSLLSAQFVNSSYTSIISTRESQNGETENASSSADVENIRSAADKVQEYYTCVNNRDMNGAIECLSPDCIYEDLGLYPKGLQGKDAMREFLSKWMQFPDDVKFKVDLIVEGDKYATGVTWHLEVGDKDMPFSRGVSFYRVHPASGLICFGRDLVEPPFKPGGAAGVAILKVLFPVMRRLPKETAESFVPSLSQECPPGNECNAATQAALGYYESVNQRDIAGAVELMSETVRYEDLALFPSAKVGRGAMSEMLGKWGGLPADVVFVVDDCTTAGKDSAGVVWHLQVGEAPMPFSRGCSFYQVDDQGKIAYARDIVEPVGKAGDSGMDVMGAVFPLVQLMPKSLQGGGEVSKEGPRSKLTMESFLFWVGYLMYWRFILLGSEAPGVPLQHTEWSTIAELLDQSLNFFYVNPALHAAGIALIPSNPSHPVNEALFNFVNAWSLMFAPIVLADPRALRAQVDRTKWWLGQFFLTNIFFIPFMALRARADLVPLEERKRPDDRVIIAGKAVGAVGVGISVISLAWAATARPEYGDLTSRGQHLIAMLTTDRVYFAFVLDMVLYSIFQFLLMRELIPEGSDQRRLSAVPFLGLAVWLYLGQEIESDDEFENSTSADN